MLLVVKRFILICLISSIISQVNAKERTIRILVAGQSISSNCNQHIYKSVPGIFQIDLNGAEQIASDPFDWADCKNGSMWIPLGQKIIKAKMAEKVVFMPIGVAGTAIKDWLPSGKAFNKLEKALRIANQNNIAFDYAFWHQGSSDFGTNAKSYRNHLNKTLEFIDLNAKVDKWIIAQHSGCNNKFDENIRNAQISLGQNFLIKRFKGPNTNQLGSEYRSDGCHLNKLGQETMAQLWLDSMNEAERVDEAAQKETLLYYFRKL